MSSTFSRRCPGASCHYQSHHLSRRHSSHHSHLIWHCRRRCTQSANYCPPSIQMFKAMMAWAKCQYLRVGQCAYGSALRRCLSGAPRVEWTFAALLALPSAFGSPSRATLSSNHLLHGHPPEPRCVELDTMRSAKSGGGTGLGACPPSLDPAQLSLGLISQPAGWIRSTPSEPNPHTCAADRTDRRLPRLWVRTSRSWLLLMKPREGGMPTSGGWVLPGCQRDKLLPACMLPAATDTTETPPAEMGACSLPSLANTGGTPRSTIPTKKLASFSVRAAIVQS